MASMRYRMKRRHWPFLGKNKYLLGKGGLFLHKFLHNVGECCRNFAYIFLLLHHFVYFCSQLPKTSEPHKITVKRGPKTTPKWGQNDTKTTPKWCRNDAELIPMWPPNDPKWLKMVQKSPQNDLIMTQDRRWYRPKIWPLYYKVR